MTELIIFKPEVAMDIVRSEQSVGLLRDALDRLGKGNMVNVSFMITPDQKAVIKKLSQDNRMSQGVVLRHILDEWMEFKLNGG